MWRFLVSWFQTGLEVMEARAESQEPQEQVPRVSEAPSLIRKLFTAHRATALRPRPNAKGWWPIGKALVRCSYCTSLLAEVQLNVQ